MCCGLSKLGYKSHHRRSLMFGDVQISQCPGLMVENTYVASWTTMKQSVPPRRQDLVLDHAARLCLALTYPVVLRPRSAGNSITAARLCLRMTRKADPGFVAERDARCCCRRRREVRICSTPTPVSRRLPRTCYTRSGHTPTSAVSTWLCSRDSNFAPSSSQYHGPEMCTDTGPSHGLQS
jgi:hypothetical protein